MRQSEKAFTLTEVLLSMVVLTLLVLMVSGLVNSASTVTAGANKRMDTDSQARSVLDRMAGDFAQMIKRQDVDYYVKSNLDPQTGGATGKNDLIAFFTQAIGYYPSPSYQSPIALVSYRIYSPSPPPSPCPNCNKLERMGKGLLWNGVQAADTPLVFGLTTIVSNWPKATTSTDADDDYELIGPQIFRFEYFYVLKSGSFAIVSGANGMQDVAAITATIAAIDPKSRGLLSDNQISTLAGRMNDFSLNMHQPGNTTTLPGDLAAQWQSALDATIDMPRVAINGIRIYQRTFYLSPLR